MPLEKLFLSDAKEATNKLKLRIFYRWEPVVTPSNHRLQSPNLGDREPVVNLISPVDEDGGKVIVPMPGMYFIDLYFPEKVINSPIDIEIPAKGLALIGYTRFFMDMHPGETKYNKVVVVRGTKAK